MTVPGPLSSDTDKPRTAIVTGADSGIGRAIAVALAGGTLDVPIPRSGDAREVAAVAAFLATPAASYVTGTSWPVDGGMLNTWRYP